jgi:nucleoid-associated protein YgaU
MQEGSASRSASGPQSPAIQSPPAPVVQKKPGPAKAPRVHLVQPGETLSGIAQQYYGSKEDWRKILAANEKTLKDANKIAPGTKLIIPD